MTIKITALRIAAACLVFGSVPAVAGDAGTCVKSASTPRLLCDEGACVRVSVKDLCDAVRASYPVKHRSAKPGLIDLNPGRTELTLLIASVS